MPCNCTSKCMGELAHVPNRGVDTVEGNHYHQVEVRLTELLPH